MIKRRRPVARASTRALATCTMPLPIMSTSMANIVSAVANTTWALVTCTMRLPMPIGCLVLNVAYLYTNKQPCDKTHKASQQSNNQEEGANGIRRAAPQPLT